MFKSLYSIRALLLVCLLLGLSFLTINNQAEARPIFKTTTLWAGWLPGMPPADFTYSFKDAKRKSSIIGVQMNQRVVRKAANFIARYEGFYSCPYNDPVGYLTVGYGHKIVAGEDYSKCITRSQARQLLFIDIEKTSGKVMNSYPKTDFLDYSMIFSNNENRKNHRTSNGGRFKSDVSGHRNANRNITLRKLKGYNQSQMVALMSFMYNLGPAIIEENQSGQLGKAIKNGNYRGIAKAMKLYDKAYSPSGKKYRLPGLTKRRKDEARLFVSNPRICWVTKNVAAPKFQVKTCYRWR